MKLGRGWAVSRHYPICARLIFAPYFLLIFLLMSAAYSSLAERCCFSLQGKALQAAARSKEKQNDLIVGNVSSDSQLENERMF